MEISNGKQIYNILQNLSNLEVSYMDYSKTPKDFVKYETYLDYFNNYIIKSHDLSRFYFPLPQSADIAVPKFISELDEVTDFLTIVPEFDIAAAKHFNFPDAIRHKCNYYSGIYLLKGHGKLELDEQNFDVNVGDFYLLPPHVFYSLTTNPESICVFFNLRTSFIVSQYKSIFHEDPLLSSFITKSLTADHMMSYLAFHTCGGEDIDHLILTIFAEHINPDKYSNNAMKNYLSLLFATFLRNTATTIDSSVKVTRNDRQYQQIVDYLKQNYQTATLTTVADYIHFSKQYICKIVKQKTGETFNHLLTDIKLSMVEQYLLESDLTIENISYLCGFTAASHLSKVFKNNYGIAPAAFRKQNDPR